jgi:hypothetical protein
MQGFKYFAFISYNSADLKWGKRLQRKLEHYKMPATLCSEHGWDRYPIKPVFFAPTDIQPNDLDDELKSRLRDSKNLIVICSPNSAKSKWVAAEIEYFHSLGRAKNIHFFIVEGSPNSENPDDECYNPIIKSLGLAGVLGANINEQNYSLPYLNRERAYVQLVTKLLGVEFDTIWQRHKRYIAERWMVAICLVIIVTMTIVSVWNISRSIDISVSLKENTLPNDNLPQLSDAEITLVAEDYVRSSRVTSIEDIIVFTNVPRSLIGQSVRLDFVDFPDSPDSKNYHPESIEVALAKENVIAISRDTIKYGTFRAMVMDKLCNPLPHCEIEVAGMTTVSDDDGNIDIQIPYNRQSQSYVVENDTLYNVGLCSRFAIIIDRSN